MAIFYFDTLDILIVFIQVPILKLEFHYMESPGLLPASLVVTTSGEEREVGGLKSGSAATEFVFKDGDAQDIIVSSR